MTGFIKALVDSFGGRSSLISPGKSAWMVVVLAVMLSATGEAYVGRRIAVLPLDVRMTQGKVDDAARFALEEMLRDVTTSALADFGWTVLTGENTLQILVDNGIDPTKCTEASCHLAAAREIKATRFISGSVEWTESGYTASVRMLDTSTGRVVASVHLEGPSTKALRAAFVAQAAQFFEDAGFIGVTLDGQDEGLTAHASAASAGKHVTAHQDPVTRAQRGVHRLALAMRQLQDDTGSTQFVCLGRIWTLYLDRIPADGSCGPSTLLNCSQVEPGRVCWGGPYLQDFADATDPWGRDYVIRQVEQNLEVVSRGPDGELKTEDDVSESLPLYRR